MARITEPPPPIRDKKKVVKSSSGLVKKKKKSTELTVSDVKLHKPNGQIVEDQEFHDILQSSANDIYRLLEVNDTDNAVQLLYKRVIQSSYHMLSKIEQSMNEGSGTRGAYPFNAVASTLRDYLVDLQSSMDKSRLAGSIIDNILRPMFMEMASQLVIEMGNITKEAKVTMTEEQFKDFNRQVIRVSQERIIECMQRSYRTAVDDAKKALQ